MVTTTPETITSSAITSVTSTPKTGPPVDPYEGWRTLDHGDYTLKYPPSYYNPISTDPVLLITDTKTTYDSWMHAGNITDSELLIQLISLTLDRNLDPFSNSSLLATPEQALQREINRAIGIAYYVSGSTNVPWENANGGTSDGRKVFYPNVSSQNIMLGNTNAAKIISDNMIYYFILIPNNNISYVRIIIQPASSTMIKVADQILSTFTFTH